MGLGTDLKSSQALVTQLTSDGASQAVITDANALVTGLQGQVTSLTAVLTSVNSLLTTLQGDGAISSAVTACQQLITDLGVQLS